MMRFIGDVHGKYNRYKRLIKAVPRSIQIGDMGIGFRRMQGPRAGEFFPNPPHYAMVAGDHRFIRGNHDNPAECRRHSQWIPDGHYDPVARTLFVGGASSVDRAWRTEGYNWWADEELSILELTKIVDTYTDVRPDVMVTHDCPQDIAEVMQAHTGQGKLDPRYASRSRVAFQHMLSAHSPKLWVFGHWHKRFDQTVQGTRFLCLGELQYEDMEWPYAKSPKQ